MSGKGYKGHVRDVRRFFWLPRETPRSPVAAWPTLQVWLFCLAVGAVGAALSWEEQGPLLMMVVVLMEMFENVVKGVRHRWPAFVAALAVGWGVNRLAYAGVPDSDSLWGGYCVYALWTLAALATFVAVTRLPLGRAF
ncbi:hypothetical protein [Streptomyces fulvoviolaceus]|uniref:hypothetical protein n=1 Tax=Streptomyces fulvoviolaceus TaxID=285535 RepID=UPI001F2C4284|nr:hypothetical protein [Streptomyces fulvoviolaceus]